MNQPKSEITTADVKRVVRNVTAALNSLKAKPKPRVDAAPVQAPQPLRSQNVRVQPARRVCATLPAVSRRVPPKPVSRPIKVALPAMPAFKRAPDRFKSHTEIIEEFRADRELIDRLGVTPEEIQRLSRVSMLGNVTCRQDVLFILRQLRQMTVTFKSPAAPSPDTMLVPYQKIEPAIPDIVEMAGWLRSQAMAKVREVESSQRARSRGVFGQFDFLSSIKTMLSWRRQPSLR